MDEELHPLPNGDFERHSILLERLTQLRQERYAATKNNDYDAVLTLDDRIHILLKKFE